jgi:chromatin structure-remodeling complex subunit RSC1/2
MVQVVKPRHSLAYLHFLAMKRKREASDVEGNDEMDVDGGNEDDMDSRLTRAAVGVRPTMTEMVRSIVVELVKEQ